MKAKKQALKATVEYKSIKIRQEHYTLVKKHKEDTGVNIDFFIGQAIVEKLHKEAKPNK